MGMGLSYEESGYLYIGKYSDLFNNYKKLHNLRMKQMLFTEEQEQKVADAASVLR